MLLDLVDTDSFFAPTRYDLVDTLISTYEAQKAKIIEIAEIFNSDRVSTLEYFVDGNIRNDRGYVSLGNLFGQKNAIKSLDAEYWSKALSLTDVFDYMPQKRRDAWYEQLKGWKEPSYKEGQNPDKELPAFEEAMVRSTLQSLLAMRSQFLAEKVDGIFRGLSGEHVTNQPEGFGKRMIVANVITSYDMVDYKKSGMITDLRAVIARYMGRDEPHHYASDATIKALRYKYGEWQSIDGGALRIKLYKKGTIHLEIHPHMAYRLNMILAHLHPNAIPEKFRKKPNIVNKDFDLLQKPLSFAVIGKLAELKQGYRYDRNSYTTKRNYITNSFESFGLTTSVKEILFSIGGVVINEVDSNRIQFDYDPTEVINEIICTGCIPDYKSHQYYPTPELIADIAVTLAQLSDTDTVLEPSAGQGGLADKIGAGKVQCVEISSLHCNILEQKGHKVFCGDFLKWVEDEGKFSFFDKIIMNPPFSEGRWQAHLKAAAGKLKKGGKLAAILPSSAKDKDLIDGMTTEFHGPYSNEFENTGVSVVISVLTK